MRVGGALVIAALGGSLADQAARLTAAWAFVAPPLALGSKAISTPTSTSSARCFSRENFSGAGISSCSSDAASGAPGDAGAGRTESRGGLFLSPTARDIGSHDASRPSSSSSSSSSSPSPSSSPPPLFSSSSHVGQTLPVQGSAFAAAACFRGGSGGADEDNKIKAEDALGVAAVAVEGLTGGTRKGGLLLDHVEDTVGDVWNALKVVWRPFGHLTRLCFGLSLLFYGMAFRTFAFHVIVFRIAGFRQVQRSASQLLTKYRKARKSIREAAAAAETMQRDQAHKAAQAARLKAARERMIAEKHRLLANGRKLTSEDIRKFMKKYNKELTTIKEEQAKVNSINSSIVSVKTSVDPNKAKSGIGGLYSALITSFTASTYHPAGQIALGLHVGTLLKTHLLDLFGPILDPIGYRLDLSTYYDDAEIPYMGSANAMGATRNLVMNIFCYALVFAVIRAHPRLALKTAMVYFGARVVTDYIVMAAEPVRRKLGLMTAVHTPWSAIIQVGLTVLGFCYHRNALHTAGVTGFRPLVMGPGFVGLVEPCVRFAVWLSEALHKIEFFTITSHH